MPCLMHSSMQMNLWEGTGQESKESDTKLLQPKTSTKIRPSVSSEADTRIVRGFLWKSAVGLVPPVNFYLGLCGEKRKKNLTPAELKLQTGTNPLLQRNASSSRLLCLDVPAFLSNDGKETTKLVRLYWPKCSTTAVREGERVMLWFLFFLLEEKEGQFFLLDFLVHWGKGKWCFILAAVVLACAPGPKSTDRVALPGRLVYLTKQIELLVWAQRIVFHFYCNVCDFCRTGKKPKRIDSRTLKAVFAKRISWTI